MSDLLKNVGEKIDELKEQAELAKEELEEKLEDSKEEREADWDNAKKAFAENLDEAKLQATLAKEAAEEKLADWKEKADPALNNFVKDAKVKAGDLGEDFKNSEYGKKILGEDGKFDMEDVKRVAGEAADKIKDIFKKDVD